MRGGGGGWKFKFYISFKKFRISWSNGSKVLFILEGFNCFNDFIGFVGYVGFVGFVGFVGSTGSIDSVGFIT